MSEDNPGKPKRKKKWRLHISNDQSQLPPRATGRTTQLHLSLSLLVQSSISRSGAGGGGGGG